MSDIVECARRGVEPGLELRTHMSFCGRCREAWNAQRRLTAQLQDARGRAMSIPVASARREQIMREFERTHRPAFRAPLVWATAAVALVLLSAAAVTTWNSSRRSIHQPLIAQQNTAAQEDLADDSGDFVPVPYALPLAAGELVSVERTQLQPVALARMGFTVNPAWGSEVSADVVVGQDGLPRAVRLVGALEF